MPMAMLAELHCLETMVGTMAETQGAIREVVMMATLARVHGGAVSLDELMGENCWHMQYPQAQVSTSSSHY